MAKSILRKKVKNKIALPIIAVEVAIALIAFSVGMYQGMTINEIFALNVMPPPSPSITNIPTMYGAGSDFACGKANKVASYSTPKIADLCAVTKIGRVGLVSITGANKDTWSWTCTVYPEDVDARFRSQYGNKPAKYSCSAPKIIDGKCGSITNQIKYFPNAPTTNLCSTGIASTVKKAYDKQAWIWDCYGFNNGAKTSCGVPFAPS